MSSNQGSRSSRPPSKREATIRHRKETEAMQGKVTQDSTDQSAPTVVLVHGAFADASSWNGVIERRQAKGVRVTAPAVLLRGITS
jgi:hypothetical protein